MLDKLLNKDIKLQIVALYQAAGVVLYTVLIATIINSLNGIESKAPDIVIAPIILSMLVLSAGITGTLVFGLPVYFTFAKNDVKAALSILGYTFIYILIFILLAGLFIFTVY